MEIGTRDGKQWENCERSACTGGRQSGGVARGTSDRASQVDLLRDVLYTGQPEYDKVVLLGPLANLLVMALMFAVFMLTGTALFTRRETNR